jgi:hypothetical protein
MFRAAYARDDTANFDYRNRTKFFGGQNDATAAQQLNQELGGQQDAAALGQQTADSAQGNAIGLANSARGGRGNTMMRSAMMQAPAARQAGVQQQYATQQANFQGAQGVQGYESARRDSVEEANLGHFRTGNNDALRQQRETNGTIETLGGIMGAVGAAAASDERMKNVLGGGKRDASSAPVIIMIGGNGLSHFDDDEEEDEAGEDAVDAMRALEPQNFEYKDEFKGAPGAGDGEYTGIMAQDLEKTPAGKGTVALGPDGMRRVDGAKLSTLNSAALSKVVKDIDKLKGAKRA